VVFVEFAYCVTARMIVDAVRYRNGHGVRNLDRTDALPYQVRRRYVQMYRRGI
jgi:hypothetical protein